MIRDAAIAAVTIGAIGGGGTAAAAGLGAPGAALVGLGVTVTGLVSVGVIWWRNDRVAPTWRPPAPVPAQRPALEAAEPHGMKWTAQVMHPLPADARARMLPRGEWEEFVTEHFGQDDEL